MSLRAFVLFASLPSCLLAPGSAHAQPSGIQPVVRPVATPEGLGDWAIRFDYQSGTVTKAPRGTRNHFRAYRVELVRQTDGSADWHHSYRFPSYGVGLHVGDFGSEPTERGVPVSVYGFLQVPIFSITDTTDVMSNLGVGVTRGFHEPGPGEDPYSARPSGSPTVYLDLGIYARQRLSRRLDLIGGVSMTHFSNGGVSLLNKGVTISAPRIAVQYSLGDRGPRRTRSPRTPFDAHWVTRVDGGMGINGVGLVWTGETYTPRGTLAMGMAKGSAWRRFHRNGQVGGGLEVSFER